MTPIPSQTVNERAADWIAARDSDRWTPSLQVELDAWLDESPLHRVAYLRLASVWHHADRLRAVRTPPSSSQRSQVLRRMVQWFAPRTAEAALAVATIAAVLTWQTWSPGERQATEIGERRTLSLVDGSRLTLNTATRLRTEVGEARRRVWLEEGETYFDIAHDARHPFEVRAGEHRVLVVGTRFTVRRHGHRVEVAVLDGQVQVAQNDAAPVLLNLGEKVVLGGAKAVVSRQSLPQATAEIGWLEGNLVFDRTSLGDAAASFNRYNRKQLRIDDLETAGLTIGGTFGATNVEAFARLLRSSFGLVTHEQDGQIIVTKAKR